MSKLIAMTKDGETIQVSPLTVKNHEDLGWKVAGKSPVADEGGEDAPPQDLSKPEQMKARAAELNAMTDPELAALIGDEAKGKNRRQIIGLLMKAFKETIG